MKFNVPSCLLVFLFGSLAFGKINDREVLRQMKAKINKPKEALSYVFKFGASDVFERHIADGDKDWVNLWPQLRRVSDAASSEMLDNGMARLLEKNPLLALRTMQTAWSSQSETLEKVKFICSLFDDIDTSLNDKNFKNAAIEALTKREKAVQSVNQEKVRPLIKPCSAAIEKSVVFWKNKNAE